jgi:hypothetical protein
MKKKPQRPTHRVITMLTEDEKEDLQNLAWDSGRSMSGYLRFLVTEAIAVNPE